MCHKYKMYIAPFVATPNMITSKSVSIRQEKKEALRINHLMDVKKFVLAIEFCGACIDEKRSSDWSFHCLN